jgi:hypothetical protein
MFAAHPTHVETETAATVVEYMFAAQFVHFAVPVVSLNLPAMQLIHGKRESMA